MNKERKCFDQQDNPEALQDFYLEHDFKRNHYSNKGGHRLRGRYWKYQRLNPDGLFMRFMQSSY